MRKPSTVYLAMLSFPGCLADFRSPHTSLDSAARCLVEAAGDDAPRGMLTNLKKGYPVDVGNQIAEIIPLTGADRDEWWDDEAGDFEEAV